MEGGWYTATWDPRPKWHTCDWFSPETWVTQVGGWPFWSNRELVDRFPPGKKFASPDGRADGFPGRGALSAGTRDGFIAKVVRWATVGDRGRRSDGLEDLPRARCPSSCCRLRSSLIQQWNTQQHIKQFTFNRHWYFSTVTTQHGCFTKDSSLRCLDWRNEWSEAGARRREVKMTWLAAKRCKRQLLASSRSYVKISTSGIKLSFSIAAPKKLN